MSDPEVIYLAPESDPPDPEYGRMWCEHNWPGVDHVKPWVQYVKVEQVQKMLVQLEKIQQDPTTSIHVANIVRAALSMLPKEVTAPKEKAK
jgi:hypothetical protein